ncbi:MAG: lipocalin-like domain-containing protein, partial [Thermodesulfobacteriota bacterium]
MSKIFLISIVLVFVFVSFAHSKEFRQAIESYNWSFPRDHGKHPEFESEWWYFTGHLETGRQTFGFELTTFRFANPFPEDLKSSWASDQVYLTHFTITDEKENKFYKYELLNREVFDFAGASQEKLKVWNGDYKVEQIGDKLIIKADNSEIELNLNLDFNSRIVLNGENGLSQKGQNPGDASYYYSIPRMIGSGNLKIKDKSFEINKASVWMDKEFFTIPESENSGWSWFSIQFDEGATLMVYQIRNKKGEPTQFSSGTYVDKTGKQHHLTNEDFNLTPLKFWKSPESKTKYPLKWNIKIPKHNINIVINPVINKQELVLEEFLNINYWEGRCLVSGSNNGQAYME